MTLEGSLIHAAASRAIVGAAADRAGVADQTRDALSGLREAAVPEGPNRDGAARQAVGRRSTIDVEINGRLTGRERLDTALGTTGASDAALIAEIIERFGPDGLLRLSGIFAAAIRDRASGALILARDPSGAIPLFVRRTSKETRWSTRLAALLDEDTTPVKKPMLRWVETGRWPDPAITGVAGIERLARGSAIVIEPGGRARRRPFWTFTPLGVPRAIAREQAERELEGAVAVSLREHGVGTGAATLGDSPALALLRGSIAPPAAETLPRSPGILDATFTRAREALDPNSLFDRARGAALDPRALFDRDPALGAGALIEAAKLAEHPLPASVLGEIAQSAAAISERAHGRGVASDLGARESLGGTPGALVAALEALAGAFESSPSAATLRQVLRHGLPIERHLERRALPGLLAQSAAEVLRRWSRHVPPALAARLERLPERPPALVEPTTGTPFTDLRFADTTSVDLEAHHAALRRLAAREGVPFAAPFLDPAVIELVFSLPPELFLTGGRTMAIAAGGEPIRQTARRQRPVPAAAEPFIERGATFLCRSAAREHDPARRDRLAGLGLFLAAFNWRQTP